jgi:poly-gamma-glutamate capsule biosynthesis protein CapA/YwtB (metallophosphatase superfamily)
MLAPLRLLPVVLVSLAACARPAPQRDQAPETHASLPLPAPLLPVAPAEPAAPARDHVTLIAGGDVSFGRLVGQMILHEPSHDFFAGVHPWLSAADVRFANLEGPLSDQRGETVKPDQPLVFTGPPGGADALARAGFSIVSTANNHAWDYGKPALLETIALLDRAGVRHAGTGPDRAASRRAEIVDAGGFRVAFLAVTDIWNDGPLAGHPADPFVARAEKDDLAAAVGALREAGAADAIVVSYHGGVEYTGEPLARARSILHAAIDAGATVVVGHHPHVIQGIEWYRDRPILYSLGNLLMRMHRDHPLTELGYLARVELRRNAAPALSVCPFRIHGVDVLPFAGDPLRALYEGRFFEHLGKISRPLGGTAIDAPGADGCARAHLPS